MHSNKVSLPTIFIRFRHVHTQNAHFGYASDFVNILCFERFGFFLVGCLHFVALRQRSINLFPFIPIHIVSIHIVSLSLCLSHCTIFSNSPFIRSNDFQNFSFDTSCLILVCVDASEMQTPRIRRIAYFISKTQQENRRKKQRMENTRQILHFWYGICSAHTHHTHAICLLNRKISVL